MVRKELVLDTPQNPEALGPSIAVGSAARAAVRPAAVECYVRALRACWSSSASLALTATACTANAVFAAGSQGDSAFVTAFIKRGGATAAVAKCHSALPALAYVALVKVIHIVAATSKLETLDASDIFATMLHWILEIRDNDDHINQHVPEFFIGAAAGDPNKGRDNERLAREILSALYALAAHDTPMILWNRVLLSAIWRLVSKRSLFSEIFELQKAALRLTMLAPSFTSFDNHFIINKILFILKVQLWRYTVEGVNAPDRDVAPLLLVAHHLHRANSSDQVKHVVFPGEVGGLWRSRAADEKCDECDQNAGANYEVSRVDPIDAPPFALRTLLFSLQTDMHTVVRRFANEFLFDLCERNVEDFTLRCGAGNTVAFIQALHAPREGEGYG